MKPVCALNNLVIQSQQHLGIQKQGSFPFEDAEVDFTDLKLISEKKKRYLLVLVCIYLGWVEALHTKTETSREEVRAMIDLIISQYGLPIMSSNDRSAFVS